MAAPKVVTCACAVFTALACLSWARAGTPCGPAATEHVIVIVDMDAAAPGCQSHIDVPGGTTIVEDVAVYIFDPLGQRTVWGIGFIGGIDRGIALGHMPGNINMGEVSDLLVTPGTPVNPGNSIIIVPPPGWDKGFVGPEVQYVEFGAAGPAVLPSEALAPVFTVDIVLTGAQHGDVFDFYLLDFITVWSAGTYGAFSTQAPLSLDTGGDVVPDGTQTIYGVDPDSPLPVPPAAFYVDFIDGGTTPGPATIRVRDGGAIPTVSGWGMVVMTALLLGAGTLACRKRLPRQA